jgi:hypothetical protein
MQIGGQTRAIFGFLTENVAGVGGWVGLLGKLNFIFNLTCGKFVRAPALHVTVHLAMISSSNRFQMAAFEVLPLSVLPSSEMCLSKNRKTLALPLMHTTDINR